MNPVEPRSIRNIMDMPLPDYKKPPVVEVAISIQFNPIRELTAARLGLLWAEFRDKFPKTMDQPPLSLTFEFFGIGAKPEFEFQLDIKPPLPRCWFLSADESELIQLQNDRFIGNWRKREESIKYPRYDSIKKEFESNYKKFGEYLLREGFNQPSINQCEITYVNVVSPSGHWTSHSEPEKILRAFARLKRNEFLPNLESVSVNLRYVIPGMDGEPCGRLYINLEPVFEPKTGQPIYIIKMVARGKPESDDFISALKFIDIGHVWIVRGFADIVTPQMNKLWERIQ